MIGIAKLQTGASGYDSDFNLTLSPGVINVFSEPGTATSPVVYGEVVNGVGPYEYEWEITGGDISILSPSESNTSFTASGGNVQYSEVAKLTVKDTGNGDLEVSKEINVTFAFETRN